MDAKDLALDNGSNSKIIEDLGAVFPWVGISVFSNRLIVKAIDSCDLARLMVASQERDVRRVFHLEAKKELEGFD